ncbi:MAG: GGDEF domain-containing protein [Ruminiclostridium sp.]|nr:GGDEF domain-containing protein [Ruminiclostridium sp.]
MNKKKTLAVLVGTTNGFFRSKCLSGIIKEAYRLNYNVAVFSLFTMLEEPTKHQVGEENIYSFLSNENIVGGVFVDYSFWADGSRQRIMKIVRSLPDFKMVIFDNKGIPGYEGVVSNDRKGFAQMVDHLIEEHGFRDIVCLSGGAEFPVSVDRMNGYIDSMTRHGIEVKEENKIFGDFWTHAATELAAKLASGERRMPEAVACGNDKSAVTLVNELIKHGIRVPEDIAVTGYDLSGDSMTNDPSVTTCTRPDIYTGAHCVCKLHKMITGEDVEPDASDDIFFVSGESCGCHRDVAFAHRYNEIDRLEVDTEGQLRLRCIQESLMAADTYDELIETIYGFIDLIRGCVGVTLCLNKDWNLFREDDNEYIRSGYQDEMFEAFYSHGPGTGTRGGEFRSSELFPPSILDGDRPIACYFNAVHFEDRCFGYQVVRYDDEINRFPEDAYHSWVSAMCVSLEYIRMQERMKLMYNRAFANSIRDAMTGLYNRQGYELYCSQVFNTAKERHLRLLVIVADLDDLKKINDQYGHVEGDNAITVAARALQTCCGNGEYCVRSGGDEFIVFGAYDYDNAVPIFYHSRIDGYLARYNTSSEKPYSVGMSAGFFIDYADSYENIDECLKIADERMYANKVSRKKGRK